ncbi:uncharacterized protein FFNC_11713 [Fusarium fujikuroi]|nr:uncharacterized protein FFNC_11713 [Fusarium fujikuroi]
MLSSKQEYLLIAIYIF